ncbi:MFS transporter [Paenibacillus chungangensis]|uniref:MFS transporter n=1 Tax=Paenibacillus chungangensis TaxID=696535 RepID=A0ABW3HQ23_9BACL
MTSQASTSASFRQHFILLVLVIIVAGMSQGLLLPLLSILLEQAGVPPEQNGLNSAAMYIGIFGTMLFIEKPVRRFGYKPVILAGIALITMACLLFPATNSLSMWFLLRLLVGVGDSALHYSTQLWIVSSSPADRRGRYISLYGMSYGLGFSLGPLGINLLRFGDNIPFYVSSAFYISVLLLMLRVSNEQPPVHKREEGERNRFRTAYRLAWYALIPSFLYGLMEASMNSSFPLYGMRIQLQEHIISLMLLSFGLGGLLLQLPLGIWSDRIGRKPILIGCGIVGASAFFAVPLAGDHVLYLMMLFMVAGGVVGSFYSLGLAYAADIMPAPILPVVNVIASIHFSIGSLMGPMLGGYGIRYVSEYSIFLFLGGAFLLFGLLGFLFQPRKLPF